MEISVVRMHQTRMHGDQSESPAELLCHVETPSDVANEFLVKTVPQIRKRHTRSSRGRGCPKGG